MRDLPPFAMILVVYLLGMVLTEFLSNNAVAVLYTPIAIELAHEVGRDQARHVERLANSALMLNPAYLEKLEAYIAKVGKGST